MCGGVGGWGGMYKKCSVCLIIYIDIYDGYFRVACFHLICKAL